MAAVKIACLVGPIPSENGTSPILFPMVSTPAIRRCCPSWDCWKTTTNGKWGDALFVALDPYWFTHSRSRKADGGWGRTLGEEEYLWLKETLEQSSSIFKFVFIHDLVGGTEDSMRGGAEAAKYFEWGGDDPDSRYLFDEMRPGWGEPIHELLKRSGVNIVFHGHDHFFAHQEYDGVTYQLVPQPSRSTGGDSTRMANEYGYNQGSFLPSSGYLKVAVTSHTTVVSYVQMPTMRNRGEGHPEPRIDYEYKVYPDGNQIEQGTSEVAPHSSECSERGNRKGGDR